jgi:hypothetical protein
LLLRQDKQRLLLAPYKSRDIERDEEIRKPFLEFCGTDDSPRVVSSGRSGTAAEPQAIQSILYLAQMVPGACQRCSGGPNRPIDPGSGRTVDMR